jgi:hypothetical protein
VRDPPGEVAAARGHDHLLRPALLTPIIAPMYRVSVYPRERRPNRRSAASYEPPGEP